MRFLTPIILSVSPFYYVGKAMWPLLVTGKVLYPAVFAAAGILLLVKIISRGTVLPRGLNLLILAIGTCALLLFQIVIGMDNYGRFTTSFNQYYGIIGFVLFFYLLFFFAPFDPEKIIKFWIWLFVVEAFLESVVLKLGIVPFMVHYDASAVYSFTHNQIDALNVRVIGLLGNRSNTSILMLMLYWLRMAFSLKIDWRTDIYFYLTCIGFIICFSGIGAIALFVSLVFYRPSKLIVFGFVMVPLLMGAGKIVSQLRKIDPEYLLFSVNLGKSYTFEFFEQIYQYPQLLLWGTPTSFRWGNADVSVFKAVTDFGVTSLIITCVLLHLLIRNFRIAGCSERFIRLTKAAILTLVVGVFHYAVLFTVPVHVLLGVLIGYSFHLKTRLIPLPNAVVAEA